MKRHMSLSAIQAWAFCRDHFGSHVLSYYYGIFHDNKLSYNTDFLNSTAYYFKQLKPHSRKVFITIQ